jgi:hypothetical protein
VHQIYICIFFFEPVHCRATFSDNNDKLAVPLHSLLLWLYFKAVKKGPWTPASLVSFPWMGKRMCGVGHHCHVFVLWVSSGSVELTKRLPVAFSPPAAMQENVFSPPPPPLFTVPGRGARGEKNCYWNLQRHLWYSFSFVLQLCKCKCKSTPWWGLAWNDLATGWCALHDGQIECSLSMHPVAQNVPIGPRM